MSEDIKGFCTSRYKTGSSSTKHPVAGAGGLEGAGAFSCAHTDASVSVTKRASVSASSSVIHKCTCCQEGNACH